MRIHWDDETAPRDVRLRGLLAEGKEPLYQNNVEFHMAVDTLAAMLPAMVDGLAKQCEKDKRDALAVYDERMREPLNYMLSPALLSILGRDA